MVLRNYRDILEMVDDGGDDEEDLQAEILDLLGYPDDVPNLKFKRPPENSRPDGKNDCYYMKLEDPNFPRYY